MAGTAYLLATCLLPVVGFSDCSSAKFQALHAVKALHGLQVPHGDIRESNILCTSEAEYTCKVIVIDLGHSGFCTPKSAFQQELLQTQQLFTQLSPSSTRGTLGAKLFDRYVSAVNLSVPGYSIQQSSLHS